jgi:hypothetical protein
MRPALALALSALFALPLRAQSATPLPAIEGMSGPWMLMFQGVAYGQYDAQGGPRGSDQTGSINWGMVMATRKVGMGELQLRGMFSLDALGVGGSGYPLLLQSGEEYRGQPIHDRQHPHNAFMELAARYQWPLARDVHLSVYAAPVGEPALGPVAFMMRPSAMDNPVAPIGHHWQDATHVSFGVLTTALSAGKWTLEGSWFNGREPDDQRWSFDPIRLDSWAGRLSFAPGAHWDIAASFGYLNSPEEALPAVSEHRETFSIAHGVAVGMDGQWSSSLIWGGNVRDGETLSNSVLAESELSLDGRNSFVVRGEYVQKSADELVLNVAPFNFAPETRFGVSEFSLGYVRELATWRSGTFGLGILGTLNVVPTALATVYGSTTPLGAVIFVRIRPRRSSMGAMGPMNGMDAQAAATQAAPPSMR